MHGFSLGTACCHGEQDAYDGYSRQGTLDEMAKRVSKTFVGGDASIHKICFLGFTLVAKIGIPLLFSKLVRVNHSLYPFIFCIESLYSYKNSCFYYDLLKNRSKNFGFIK
jgi:hypothetical protein